MGAHRGETLEEAVKPRWAFDRIWSFEPASVCHPDLGRYADADPRVEVVPAGWGSTDATIELHDPGTIGASIHAGKALTSETETCRLVDAAAWMADHVSPTDQVWLKLNCEGAECDIIDRLIDSGEIAKVDHLVIHFDVEKIPGLGHRAAETRVRLDAAGVPYMEAAQIMFGRSRALGTANWLEWTEAVGWRRLRCTTTVRWVFRLRQLLYPIKLRLKGRSPVRS